MNLDPPAVAKPMERRIDHVAPWESFPPPTGERTPDTSEARPWEELKTTGLLWLINATVFHPRGYALGLFRDSVTGEFVGWVLLGDGTEPWTFSDEGLPEGQPTVDDLFSLAKELLA